MRPSRSSRLIAAAIALVSMLFMQLALASYACPGRSTGIGPVAQAMPAASGDDAMESCADMDPVQPSLCHAYDQADNQSLDKPQHPDVQPFVARGLAQPIGAAGMFLPEAALIQGLRRGHATAPPIAIRHCCLRI